jgi:hypothetical protein
MSRILRSTVVGIALILALGATAAAARPLHRTAGRTLAPAGVAERIWGWWNDLTARLTPAGRGGLSPLSGKAGSQMDPNGGVSFGVTQPIPPGPKSPDL